MHADIIVTRQSEHFPLQKKCMNRKIGSDIFFFFFLLFEDDESNVHS